MAQPGQDPYGYPKLDIKAARALAPHEFTIKIDSILGGESAMTHFSGPNQFQTSIGIDPSGAGKVNGNSSDLKASGIIIPMYYAPSSPTLNSAPMWMLPNPKDNNIYVYDYSGSTYTYLVGVGLTGLSDAGAMSSAIGNGGAYYDNYMYFAKNTDIARYGPLNGVPLFNGTYWTGTLSKAALTNTTYPTNSDNLKSFPNHFLHRHSDGKLYIADVVGNQGTLHFIQTTKTTVEGDTDAGSTFSKLTFGYGLWPTAIESYGSSIAVALYEGSSSPSIRQTVAKLAFWDTTSQNFNSITWVEFPDAMITGLKNINGVLYITSTNSSNTGFRVTRYVGGSTFEELAYIDDGAPPFPGGIDGNSNRLLFGSYKIVPTPNSCVYSLGLKGNITSIKNLFTPIRGTDTSHMVTALTLGNGESLLTDNPVIGCNNGEISGSSSGPILNNLNPIWWSQVYSLGQTFKITKIIIPFNTPIGLGGDTHAMDVGLYIDNGYYTSTVATVSGTTYPLRRNVTLRPSAAVGQSDFFLSFTFKNNPTLYPKFPIIIKGEFTQE